MNFINPKTDFAFNAISKAEREGRKEQAIAIAKRLFNILDDQTISQTTGLSLEEIHSLRRGED
jgi:DNA-binding transcriptional regulator YiaG